MLFLTGYEFTMEDQEQCRQWNSRTSGHPERGACLAWKSLQVLLDKVSGTVSECPPLNDGWPPPSVARVRSTSSTTTAPSWLVMGIDGRVAAEAASLAGTLRLGRLIILCDANLITLSATTDATCTEDVGARCEA